MPHSPSARIAAVRGARHRPHAVRLCRRTCAPPVSRPSGGRPPRWAAGPWPILPREPLRHPGNARDRPKHRAPRRGMRPRLHHPPGARKRTGYAKTPTASGGRGLPQTLESDSRTGGHGVGRLRPQVLLGAIRLDLAVHEEPADGGQCDQEQLLQHRATSSFLDVGDLWRPTIHTDRYRSVTCVRPQLGPRRAQ
ncbi:hypothetical protein SGPA1_50290 [Streptomyces misionensis JCM 4497]